MHIVKSFKFEKIDNEIESYSLGLIFADGSIGHNVLVINLKEEDGYILNRIGNYISPNHSGKIRQQGKVRMYNLNICSKEIVENLMVMGIEKNKSRKELVFPSLSSNLLRHFIRGVFDGDGCIHIDRVYPVFYICCSSKDFLLSIKSVLEDQGIESSIRDILIAGKKFVVSGKEYTYNLNMHRLYVRKKDSIIKLHDYLYSNSDIFLIRKKKVFDKSIKIIGER